VDDDGLAEARREEAGFEVYEEMMFIWSAVGADSTTSRLNSRGFPARDIRY
jgi:hypothetical protein